MGEMNASQWPAGNSRNTLYYNGMGINKRIGSWCFRFVENERVSRYVQGTESTGLLIEEKTLKKYLPPGYPYNIKY